MEQKSLTSDLLACGSKIQLTSPEASRAKWNTILIGARPTRYLIVEMPRVAGAPMKLDDGSHWVAIFINRGMAYSFKTQILGYAYRLEPILFLSYPTVVDVSNLRIEKRYPVNIPMVFRVKKLEELSLDEAREISAQASPPGEASEISDQGQMTGLVADISENGFLLVTPLPLPQEAVIDGTLYLPNEEPLAGIIASCRVCRGKPGSYFIGLIYLPTISPAVVTRLDELINSITTIPLRI